jgi:WD40 repeat protein
VAIDPHGGVRWELVRSALSDPSWYSPTGYRVAYLTGDQVRVVAGDGSGDHLLATGVARVAPAWRPAHPYQLAYVSGGGRVVLRDADTRRLIWSAPAIGGVELLEWSPGGQRLLVVSRSSVRVFTPGSAASSTISLPAASPVVDGALSPDGRILALVLGGEGGAVYTDQLTGRQRALHRVLAGVGLRQVIWSPDGRWLLVSWPAANQWVFVRVLGAPRIAAVSRISQTFATGRHQSFPQLDGWCCTAAQAPR